MWLAHECKVCYKAGGKEDVPGQFCLFSVPEILQCSTEKWEAKGYIDKLNHLNLFFMCPWYCKIKAPHPCQALKCQIWGSLKAAACLIRSPYRAAQSCSSLSIHDLFFNKGDQDGSLCNVLCCTGCSAAGCDDLQTLSAALMSMWTTWRKQCLLIALNASSYYMGLLHSWLRRELQDSLCGYEFLNVIWLLPSGFLHQLPGTQGTKAYSLGLCIAVWPSSMDLVLAGHYGRPVLLASFLIINEIGRVTR